MSKEQIEEMASKCDTCLNSRAIVSENGIHCICCLPEGLAFLCQIGKVDRYKTLIGETPNE